MKLTWEKKLTSINLFLLLLANSVACFHRQIIGVLAQRGNGLTLSLSIVVTLSSSEDH